MSATATATPTLRDNLLAKQAMLLQRAKLVVDTAERENRAVTEDEDKVYKSLVTESEALGKKIDGLTSGESFDRAFADLMGGGTDALHITRTARTQSLGEAFTASADVLQFFKSGLHRRSGQWTSPGVDVPHFGATLITEAPGSAGPLVVPDYRPGVVMLAFPRVVVGALIAPGTTESNVVQFMKEKTFTNAADTVAEGAPKPESTLVFEAAQSPLVKVAHWIPATEEALEDVAQLRSIIDARLRDGVAMKEEDQLLNGDGVAPNMRGFLALTGLAPNVPRVDPQTNADAVLNQIFAIWINALVMPDGIVMNPANWQTLAQLKTTTGEYIGSGPFAAPQTPTLWGLPVALTPAITAGKALVGAFRAQAQTFRKGGVRVEATNAHSTFFVENKVAIRAEERLALAVYREAAFGTVTNLN